jgi:predicted nucleic acid-binding protein
MATSHEAYVDTSALIAFMDGSDSHNAIFARLFADPPRLCTSPLVIDEI